MSPFSSIPAETVSALGETALLRAIHGWLGETTPLSPWGMGDDCAVLDTGGTGPILATTDGLIHGRHFDDSCEPEAAGAKLVKRNLSDIAAMGGSPGPALIALILGPNVSTSWLERFYAGIIRESDLHGVTIVGGDISEGPAGFFAAYLTLLGTAGDTFLRRSGASAGDTLFVTGELGGSILGKHLAFAPRLPEGRYLAELRAARGVIDVTDGLAKDLPEILPEGTDAMIDAKTFPISQAARTLSERDGKSPLVHALTDGEDYELLFALEGQFKPERFEALWREHFSTPLHRIGKIAPALDPARPRVIRDAATNEPLLPPGAHGYEHLR